MERIRGCSKEGVEKRKVERGRKDMEMIWRWSSLVPYGRFNRVLCRIAYKHEIWHTCSV